ncbi:MAG: leucine-rich repeat domain-containing protein [Anaeroplasmataceae bacterium]|nr:leucine-rich repeat domain-containing protein [Anaeroplasmataceae bacterium]
MKKKNLFTMFMLLFLLCFVFVLAACGEKCEHKYNTKYDDTYHWYECEKCSDIEHKEKHNTSGSNGECTVCHYKKSPIENPPIQHTHNWATSLTHDETHHWYACTITGCTERNEEDTHKLTNGICVCGYEQGGNINPPVDPDTGDESFKNVSVSANGILSWNKIKGATKYVLNVTYATESDSTEYTVDKTKNSVDLNELRESGFPAGKSMVEILVYENVKVEIDGQTGYQEVLMTDVKESFRIVKSNGSYSLVRLSYTDEHIKLDGFYAEKQKIENKDVYLFEQVLKDNKPMTLKIKNYVKATDSNHTVYFYKSEAGRNEGNSADIWDSYELQMGYPQVTHGANFYYIRVVDKATEQVYDYDLCVYGLYTLTLKRVNASFTETNGLRDYTYTALGEDLKYTEMDIVPQDVLYDGVESGKLARTAKYQTVEKEDLTILSEDTELTYYFYDEAVVRLDCQAYAEWSQTYNLSESDRGWYLSCNYDKATGMVILPNILLGKKVISASFDYSEISALVVEEGAEALIAAFTDCWKLMDIFLPSTITDMAKNSFKGVNSNVFVHCAFERSATNAFPLYWDYDVNKKVTTEFGVKVPENALTIENGLVFSATEQEDELSIEFVLKSFDGNIPETVMYKGHTYIVTRLNATISEFDELIISKNIKEISNNALDNVQKVVVSEENPYFIIKDDLLYNKDFTTFLRIADKAQATNLRSLVIDYRVQEIAFGALSEFRYLQSLTLPFVGASIHDNSNTHFGYIFGASSYMANSSNVPTTLQTVVITNDSKIDSNAFYNCSYIMFMTISNSVEGIGFGAFTGCSKLLELKLPFVGASRSDAENSYLGYIFGANSYTKNKSFVPGNLRKVAVTDGTAIGFRAFSDCTSIAEISIPDSVTIIDAYAFENTSWYKNQPDGLIYAGKVAYEYKGTMPQNTSIIIKEGTKGIGTHAFSNCTGLVSVSIPDSVISIGSGAFRGCTGLTDISIANSVTSISDYAFYECSGLLRVTIPCEVNSIGFDAFKNCKNIENVVYLGDLASWCEIKGLNNLMAYGKSEKALTINEKSTEGEIIIPDEVTSISSYAFYRISAITSISIPESVINIGNFAFHDTAWFINQPDGVIYAGKVIYKHKGTMSENTSIIVRDETIGISDYAFSGCRGLIGITIPDSVIYIGSNAFSGCSRLESIVIPKEITSLNTSVFSDCTALTSVSLPQGLLSIGEQVFFGCTNLTEISIPDGVTSIGLGAFNGCYFLAELVIPDSVVSIGSYAFYNVPCDYEQIDNLVYMGKVAYEFKGGDSVTIQEGTKGIAESAFRNRTGLTSVVLPNTLINIDEAAFWQCTQLTDITFNGTIEEWNAISKGQDWDTYTGDYIVHCTDGDIHKS